jgi:hypothetical protein
MVNFDGIDPAVDNMFLMGSPVPMVALTILYLTFVLKTGPKIMENRKPFELKKTIFAYNVFQIIYCTALVYLCIDYGFTITSIWQCVPENMAIAKYDVSKRITIGWYTMFIKLIEMLETIFFVLRKKQNQISLLHVYHHVTSFVMLWLFVKYSLGYMEIFIVFLNSIVHMIMYTYYCLAIFKSLTKYLRPIKPIITIIQMVQFIAFFGHVLVAIQPSCKVTRLFYFHLLNFPTLFYMFADFFYKSYRKIK